MYNTRLVLLGTGASTCVPNLGCLLDIRGEGVCHVCREASSNPASMNRRNNPSLLLQPHYLDASKSRAVVIDCGKTFRAAVERFFPKLGVRSLDAVMLTHDHADAVLGLDDLRDLQRFHKSGDQSTQEALWQAVSRMQVFCSDQTYTRMKEVFPYLTAGDALRPSSGTTTTTPPAETRVACCPSFSSSSCSVLSPPLNLAPPRSISPAGTAGTAPAPPSVASSSKSDSELDCGECLHELAAATLANEVPPAAAPAAAAPAAAEPVAVATPAKEPMRFISQLEWNVIAELDDEGRALDPAFEVAGFAVQPVRLHHGGTYLSLGFVFGAEGSRVAYLSDVKLIPAATLAYLTSIAIDVLVLDALFVDRKHSTHFNLHEALEAVEHLKPKRTILTGMTDQFNYYTKNAELQLLKDKQGRPMNVCMGYDGLEIFINV